MKAVIIDHFGGVETLKLTDVPKPEPKEHEVLIQIEYAAVNPVDWKIREGMLKNRLPHEFPIIPGWDASGTIAEVGSNADNFNVGDEVFAYCRKPIVHAGTYAEYICFDADHVALKPKNISFAEAAGIPLVALTAWQALFDFAKLKPHQNILIHAGSGGVGSYAIQFAKQHQATVWTTCSEKNIPYVKELGADHVIDYTKENFAKVIQDQFKEGIDVVFDTVGGPTLKDSVPLVKKGGTLITITEMVDPTIGEKNGIKAGFVFVRPNGKELTEIAHLIEQGKIKVPHTTEMSLNDASLAQAKSQEGHCKGKIVLKVK